MAIPPFVLLVFSNFFIPLFRSIKPGLHLVRYLAAMGFASSSDNLLAIEQLVDMYKRKVIGHIHVIHTSSTASRANSLAGGLIITRYSKLVNARLTMAGSLHNPLTRSSIS